MTSSVIQYIDPAHRSCQTIDICSLSSHQEQWQVTHSGSHFSFLIFLGLSTEFGNWMGIDCLYDDRPGMACVRFLIRLILLMESVRTRPRENTSETSAMKRFSPTYMRRPLWDEFKFMSSLPGKARKLLSKAGSCSPGKPISRSCRIPLIILVQNVMARL